MRPRLPRALAILTVVFAVSVVHAAPLDVALHLQNQSIDLNFSGDVRDTDINSLDILWYQPLAPRLEGAVMLGYLDISQNQHPLDAGRISSGGYAGLSLRYLFISTASFRLETELSYRYAETDHQVGSQDVEWRWHDRRLGFHGKWQVSEHFAFSAGVTGISISGNERLSGTVTQTTQFETQDSTFGHLGAFIGLDQPGQIGIEITTGSLRGGRLVFQRSF